MFKLQQNLNKKIWENISNTNNYIVQKTLNNDQSAEYNLLKNLSDELMIANYKRNPIFNSIRKTCSGYTLYRHCIFQSKHTCTWIIKININTNEAKISCQEECNHEANLKKGKF
jgi:hypothetical protein